MANVPAINNLDKSVEIPEPNKPKAGKPHKPLIKIWLPHTFNNRAMMVMVIPTVVRWSPSMKLFKAINQNMGKTETEIKLKKGRVKALLAWVCPNKS